MAHIVATQSSGSRYVCLADLPLISGLSCFRNTANLRIVILFSIVGEKFFIKMFEDHPELVQLFPFGDDVIDSKTGALKLNARVRKHVRAHAAAVMRTVGSCVAGLTSLEELVPRLRSVGATHKMVGVQSMHYNILYRHLIAAIRDDVGPDFWDEDTEDAWLAAYGSISELIQRPSRRLETEPLKGWGIVMLLANVYFTLVTPFRFAGFYVGHLQVIRLLDTLDIICAMIMGWELFIWWTQTKLRVSRDRFIADATTVTSDDEFSMSSGLLDIPWFRRQRWRLWDFFNRFRDRKRRQLLHHVKQLKMDRWVAWPSLDVRVLLSFALQRAFYHGSLCSSPGLHWTQLFGLLRVTCASRVVHFVQCAENNFLLQQKLDADRQATMRIFKLLVRLAFMTHVSACLWCTVARVELGPQSTSFEITSFFPNPEILGDPRKSVINSYTRAIHWAFVNLSGIGGVDSVPQTTLECSLTLIVHVIGAVFYAVVTGNVISMLELQADGENKIGRDIVQLSNFLKMARVSEASKERVMKGYILRNVLTAERGISKSNLKGEYTLDMHDEVLNTLPNYLRMEVGIYARAELLRRQDKFFEHCSKNFLVALSSSLVQSRTLLTGDYLIKRGEHVPREFLVVQAGELQIRRAGSTVRTLKQGDAFGKAWLTGYEEATLSNSKDFSEFTDWLDSEGRAALSIRALSPCVVMTGLAHRTEIDALERAYPVDFKFLRTEIRGHNTKESDRLAMALRGIAKAVRRFKRRRLITKIKNETDLIERELLMSELHEQIGRKPQDLDASIRKMVITID